MALTEKGIMALNYINKFFADGTEFSAADLSTKAEVKIVAKVFEPLVKNCYLERLGGSPVMFKVSKDFEDLFKATVNEATTVSNENLHNAKREKNDEFYTVYEDIEAELLKYKKYFRGKVVYLPCDDPLLRGGRGSEFWNYFETNFMSFGLKKLIATHYSEDGDAYKIWIENDINNDGYIDGDDVLQEDLLGNGDFNSPECREILKECDIVVTNPPFSMFRDFLKWIISEDKQFLIIGNKNAYTYKEVFPLINDNKVWVGYTVPGKIFHTPEGDTKKMSGLCRWFTNMPVARRNEELILTSKYNEFNYPKYDNYKAIEVGEVKLIPKDYDGVMGVPITYIDHYNPNQFEMIGMTASWDESEPMKELKTSKKYRHAPRINDEEIYRRILIKKKAK